MKKQVLKMLLLTWAAVMAALNVNAVTYTGDELPSEGIYDYTSYVTNPDFSTTTMSSGAPTGWTWTGSSSYSKISTAAKGTGNPIAASQPHWQVWGDTGTMSQTVNGLPNGTYYLTCTVVTTSSDNKVFAGSASVACVNGSYYYCVKAEVTDCTLTIGIQKGNSTTVELDDIHLYSTVKPKKKVFTIGDSTMANKSSSTERGWGMLFGTFLDTDAVTLSNNGIDGYSTKSYIDGGKWTTVLDQLSEGDYVLIQFGHNDEKTDASLHTEPTTTYTENLTKFITESRDKGAVPVLISPIVRRKFGSDGNIVNDHTAYTAAMAALATSLSVPYIDMTQLSAYYENIAGIVGTRALHEYYPGTATDAIGEIDNTHLCDLGAYITARCIAEQIATNSDIDIAINSNPTALDGAYTSTLEYAQNAITALYSDIAGTDYSTLAALDEAVRARRLADRQALANPTSDKDATFCVVNSDMLEGMAWDNDAQMTVMMGWQFTKSTSGTFSNSYKRADGVTYFGPWAAQVDYMDLHQTITNLPNGTYRLTATVKCSTNTGSITSGMTKANYMYATSNGTTYRTDMTSPESWETVNVVCDVTDGTLTFGMRSEYGCYSRMAGVTLTALAPVDASMKVGDAHWGTFIAPFEVAIPDGVEVYTTDGITSSNMVVLTPVSETIPANTAVILRSDNMVDETFNDIPRNTKDAYTTGLLTGTLVATTAPANSYVLQQLDDLVGFYKVESDNTQCVGANRAYLTLPATEEVKWLTLSLEQETAINALQAQTQGQAPVYDLKGCHLATLQKGINIVGGKKVLVK